MAQTRVIKGLEATKTAVVSFLEKAASRRRTGSYVYSITDRRNPDFAVRLLPLVDRLRKENPQFTGRYITDVQKENAAQVRRIMNSGVEVRHLEGNKISFSVSPREYLNHYRELSKREEIIWSNASELVSQMKDVFQVCWESAKPVDLRLLELEEGTRTGETKLTFSTREVFDAARKFIGQMKREALVVVPREGGISANVGFFDELTNKAAKVGAHIMMLAQFSKDEVGEVRKLEKRGVEIRSPSPGQRFDQALGIYDRKGMALVRYVVPPGSDEGRIHLSGVISTEKSMIDWLASIFSTVWEGGIPVDERIALLEKGTLPQGTRVVNDPREVLRLLTDLSSQAKREILLLLPSVNAFHREERIGVMKRVTEAARKGVRVKVITPMDDSVRKSVEALSGEKGQPVSYQRLSSDWMRETATVLVVDRVASLVLEQRDDSNPNFLRAIGRATYSTSASTVLVNVQFFQRMWHEIVLRTEEDALLDNERRSRERAELLQDILTHDIRNYDQIIALNAELLKEKSQDLNDKKLVDSILQAVTGSTMLIDRAKKIGRLVAEKTPELHPVDAMDAIREAASLVERAYPKKKLLLTISGAPTGQAKVLADELLPEVFTNVLSNSMKYTDGERVHVMVSLGRVRLPQEPANGEGHPSRTSWGRRFWKVTIRDRGRGMSADTAKTIFTRYQRTSTGSGLGLYIVRSLVEDRYSGKVELLSNIAGKRSGTTVGIWLPSAE